MLYLFINLLKKIIEAIEAIETIEAIDTIENIIPIKETVRYSISLPLGRAREGLKKSP